MLSDTGMLGGSNTIAAVNWTLEGGTLTRDDIQDRDKVQGKDEPDDMEKSTEVPCLGLAYNCVVYGLPHITLIAP